MLTRQESIDKYISGHDFELVSQKPVAGEFKCVICLGKGKNAYELKREDGEKIKVGKGCLKQHFKSELEKK